MLQYKIEDYYKILSTLWPVTTMYLCKLCQNLPTGIWLMVSYCDCSMSVINNCFKRHLFLNNWLDFWKRCFLKTSVSNGIIYTKYTQNPHTIEPPFNIATQSAT